jgi:hypothetical protein
MEAHTRAGDAAVHEMLEHARIHRATNGSFPSERHTVSSPILGFIPGPSIFYIPSEGDCVIYYNQWPLGPKHGVECNSEEWKAFSS